MNHYDALLHVSNLLNACIRANVPKEHIAKIVGDVLVTQGVFTNAYRTGAGDFVLYSNVRSAILISNNLEISGSNCRHTEGARTVYRPLEYSYLVGNPTCFNAILSNLSGRLRDMFSDYIGSNIVLSGNQQLTSDDPCVTLIALYLLTVYYSDAPPTVLYYFNADNAVSAANGMLKKTMAINHSLKRIVGYKVVAGDVVKYYVPSGFKVVDINDARVINPGD